MNNIRTMRKVIREMNQGDKIYINAICISENMINYLRECIQNGTLKPDRDEVETLIVESARYKYMSGECIAPQMTYTKF